MEELTSSVVAGAHTARRLLLAGVSAHELRGPLWTQAHPGRYAFAATDPHHPRQRALVGASVLPSDGGLGGWAAAYLQGASRLDGSTADPDRYDPVLLCMPRRCQRQWWPGLRPFRSELDADDVVVVDGVAVTSPLRTTFDLGRLAPSDTEAVVALDAAASGLDVDLGEVEAYARARPGWRGTPRLRRALQLADPRARSAQESRFRVLWRVEAGLPRPLCNWSVRTPDGFLLAEVDLLDVEAGVVGEYDGAHHAAADQRAVDNARHEVLERHGLRVVQSGRHRSDRRTAADRAEAPRGTSRRACAATAPSTVGCPTPSRRL